MSDMSNGKKVEPSRLYTVTKIINMLKNVKTYEDSAVTKNAKWKLQSRSDYHLMLSEK